MPFPSTRALLVPAIAWLAILCFVDFIVAPKAPLRAAFWAIFLIGAPIAYFIAKWLARKLPELHSPPASGQMTRTRRVVTGVLIGVSLFCVALAAVVGIGWYFS